MSLLDLLSDENVWLRFYEYKTSLISRSSFQKELLSFIKNKGYLPVCKMIKNNEPFPLPSRAVINKNNGKKKRVVYTYPYDENMVLKLLTHLILRKYDYLFCDGLYSFRPSRCAKDAVKKFIRDKSLRNSYFYKADISNYFNSVPVPRLTAMLRSVMSDDNELCGFLCALLEEKHVKDKGNIIGDNKGIMAGTPLSAFYANLYLMSLDKWFSKRNIRYARYSDDIIVFSQDESSVKEYAAHISEFLNGYGLEINHEKECFGNSADGWTFLGFSCKDGKTDISPVTVKKIKAKMRRKTRSLRRWQLRNGLDGEKSAAAFIRICNKKLLESPDDNELSWSCWFFSVINTAESLKIIDRYAQDCIRYLISGKHTKSRFNVRYEDMKLLGYKSLVHEYYSFSKGI